jgi:H+/gluconate symporter-like permease
MSIISIFVLVVAAASFKIVQALCLIVCSRGVVIVSGNEGIDIIVSALRDKRNSLKAMRLSRQGGFSCLV